MKWLSAAIMAVLASNTVLAQTSDGESAQAGDRVRVFPLEHAEAADAASTLDALSRGIDGVSIVPHVRTNSLFVRADAAVLERIGELVTALDRPPATIDIDVTLLELSKAADHPAATGDFSGDVEQVNATIANLEAEGAAKVIERIHLTSLENQIVQMQVGANEPVVRGQTRQGFSRDGRAPATAVMSLDNTGTIFTATSRVAGDCIVAELAFEKSSISKSADEAEDGSVPLSEKRTIQIRGTVGLVPGQVAVLGEQVCNGPEGKTRVLLLATARTRP